jgi:hypothetical protein
VDIESVCLLTHSSDTPFVVLALFESRLETKKFFQLSKKTKQKVRRIFERESFSLPKFSIFDFCDGSN